MMHKPTKPDMDYDFSLPVFTEPGPDAPELSMDEYIRFIEMTRKHIVSANADSQVLERSPVMTQFVLDSSDVSREECGEPDSMCLR